eukprot:Colp12_sorted_trinity150504_noHs@5127
MRSKLKQLDSMSVRPVLSYLQNVAKAAASDRKHPFNEALYDVVSDCQSSEALPFIRIELSKLIKDGEKTRRSHLLFHKMRESVCRTLGMKRPSLLIEKQPFYTETGHVVLTALNFLLKLSSNTFKRKQKWYMLLRQSVGSSRSSHALLGVSLIAATLMEVDASYCRLLQCAALRNEASNSMFADPKDVQRLRHKMKYEHAHTLEQISRFLAVCKVLGLMNVHHEIKILIDGFNRICERFLGTERVTKKKVASKPQKESATYVSGGLSSPSHHFVTQVSHEEDF